MLLNFNLISGWLWFEVPALAQHFATFVCFRCSTTIWANDVREQWKKIFPRDTSTCRRGSIPFLVVSGHSGWVYISLICRCRLCILDSHISPDDLYIYVAFFRLDWGCIKTCNRSKVVWLWVVVKSVWHYHCNCRPEFYNYIRSSERLLSITVGWQLSPSGAPRPRPTKC